MGFAEDKVYDYILKNLKNFRNIRVASLADSLSCLTDADRDELHAREETRGSQATVYKFYQHLKCRQGWVLDLIDALRQNNAGHLADELQHVYDSWQARPPAPATASLPPAASDACPTVSSIGAQAPSPRPSPAPGGALAEQPCREPPVISHPPLLPGAATTTSKDLDARAPVQESLPKKLLEHETPQPPLPGSSVCDRASDERGGEGHLPHPIEAVQVAVGTPGTASVAMPLATPPAQGRDWLSHQKHPVCVDNGCFGNANHLHRGAPALGLGRSLPLRDVAAPCSLQQPRNEPEEDFYISTESRPRPEETARTGGPEETARTGGPEETARTGGPEETARSGGPQLPDSLLKSHAVPGSGPGEPPGSFVDVRSPLLIQQQFDAEQKRVGMLQQHGGDEATWMETATPVATPAPGDASPSCDDSLKPPVQEENLLVGKMGSSTPSTLTKEKVLPASADPLPPAAGSFEGTSRRMASQVSSATSIWIPCSNVERDVELSKPGILLSVTGEGLEAASRCPSTQGPSNPCSGLSDSLTFSSDPLLVSTDSSSSGEVLSGCPAPGAHEDTRAEKAAEGSRNSHPPASCDNTSLGTHEVHVEHSPSTQLGAGSEFQDRARPLGSSPIFDSSRVRGTETSLSQATAPPGDSNGPSLPYIIPAVGIALISAAAFLVYARLQK
ncbi:mitochondrial antiviral-signaling protein isoform X1 [Phalacrocorax aristotelis]|uniref:mitochondrial antiviral-signaling protein isoform X1 n=1 Tax=Phalacrocorax aristotelis TaxID=126867 RepID=UPI003F4BE523